MEINDQQLRLQANNEINAKSVAKKAKEEPQTEQTEQSQEYGKNLNFTGLRNMSIRKLSLGAIKNSISESRAFKPDEEFEYAYGNLKAAFPVEISDLTKIAKENKLKQKSKGFLINMMHRQNDYNFSQNKNIEDGWASAKDSIMELFKRVKNPQEGHNEFIDNSNLSMNDIKKCFDKCDDDPRLLGALGEVETFAPKEDFPKIIERPTLKSDLEQYANHTEKAVKKSNDRDENRKIIKRAINKFFYSDSRAENHEEARKLTDTFKEHTQLVINQDLKKYATDERNSLLNSLTSRFNTDNLSQDGEKVLGDIYKSTNKNNVAVRSAFLDFAYVTNFGEKRQPVEELREVNKLFNTIDKDKNAFNFVDKYLKSNVTQYNALNAHEVNSLFDTYGTATVANRSANLISKMNKHPYSNQYEIATGYLDTPETVGERLKGLFSSKQSVETAKPSGKPYPTEIQAEEVTAPAVKETKAKRVKPEIVKGEKVQFSLAEANKQKLLSIMTNSPSNTMSKKLKITQDSVSPILKKNIKSERVLNEQEYIYATNATKMRANMLPDIFESIKATRAEAKAANGGKLPKGFAKNEDALELYTKINGKNKKLVNYMLKQTKTDEAGKTVRAFNIKDIINTLDNVHKDAYKAKHNASGAKFTAKDEKAMYDGVLKNLKSEYGELPKQPRVKKSK